MNVEGSNSTEYIMRLSSHLRTIVKDDHVAKDYLKSDTTPSSPDMAFENLVHNFMVSSVHAAHGAAIINMTVPQAFTYLSSLSTPENVDDYVYSRPVADFNTYKTFEEFKTAVYARSAKIASLDATSHHLKPRAMSRFLLEQFPRTEKIIKIDDLWSHTMRRSADVTHAYYEHLWNDLKNSGITPQSKPGGPGKQYYQGHSYQTPPVRRRILPGHAGPANPYGRAPGLDNPPGGPYRCPPCKMDNHQLGNPGCLSSQSRGNFQQRPYQGQVRQGPSPPRPYQPQARVPPPERRRQAGYDMANMAAAFQALGRQQATEEALAAPPSTEEDADQFYDTENVNGDAAHFLYPTSPIVNALPSPILDSGASSHLLPSGSSFSQKMAVNVPVKIADGTSIPAIARGDASLRTGSTTLLLRSALHVPDLARPLVSAARLAKDFCITMLKNRFYLTRQKSPPSPTEVIAKGTTDNNVFVFEPPTAEAAAQRATEKQNAPPQRPAAATPRFQIPTAFLHLHNLFPHRHISGLRRLITAIPQLKPKPRHKDSPLNTPCNPCVETKMTRAPHIVDSDPPPSRPLHKVTLDTGGPFPPSVRGFCYINPLSDTFSSISLPLPSKTKGGASLAVTETLARWQTKTGKTTVRIQTDGAKELSKSHIGRFCKAQGTDITTPPPNHPTSNGHAERRVNTHKADIRAALAAAPGGIPESYWCYAAEDAADKANFIPQPFSTTCPLQLFHPQSFRKEHALRFQIFGQWGYIPNPKQKPTSLENRGLLCRYLRSPNYARYDVVFPNGKINTCRPTEFSPCPPPPSIPSATSQHPAHIATHAEIRAGQRRPALSPRRHRPAVPTCIAYVADSQGLACRRAYVTRQALSNPSSLKQALSQPDSKAWGQAYDKFLDRQFALGAWKLVPSSPSAKPCRGTFVFRRKTDGEGNIISHSVRYAARGDLMQPNVHYDPAQTSAQTPSHAAHRMLYAEAARRREFMESYDVPGAYARAPADPRYKVRLHQPRRADGLYTKAGHDVLIVNAQQGVPDAGNRWEKHRNAIFRRRGWRALSSEPSAFRITSADGKSYARLLATTDDFILTSNNLAYLHHLRDAFVDEWDITVQSPVDQHAGLKVIHTPTKISLSAPKHIDTALELAGMSKCNPAKTPQDPNADMTAKRTDEQPLTEEEHALYRKVVGTLRYVADTVGYEIAYTISALAAHQNSPCARHQHALHRLLRYVAGRRDMGVCYTSNAEHPSARFEAYVDSDWAGCLDSRRSRTGTAVQYAGDLIHWSSKMQATVSDSSAEAEYVAAATASKQVQWLRMLAAEWRIHLHTAPTPFFMTDHPLEPTRLHIDNSGAISMIQANGPTRRSKHVDIKHHAVNERARLGIIVPTKVHTTQQKADFLTKCLHRVKFEHNLALIRHPAETCLFAPESSRGVTAQDRIFDSVAHKRVRFDSA